MALTIRPATPADIPQLIPLFAEHADFEAASFVVDGEFAGRLVAAASGAQPRVQLWLAVEAENVLGYAAASCEFCTWSATEYLHLDCLYVREARRGAGTGARLVSAVVERAQQMGLTEIQWQTPAWNSRAIAFYRRLGAKALEKQRFYLDIISSDG